MNINKKLFKPFALLLGAGLALQASTSLAAKCEYVVQSDWNSGFVAAIRITNDTTTAIDGWSVNWSYTDGSTRTGGWNANFSGSNPYTASAVDWNRRINPGQTVEFGFQGNKGVFNGPVQRPTVTGAVCSATSSPPRTSSSSSLTSSSSSRPSSSSIVSSSSSSRTSVPSSSSSAVSSGPNTPPVVDVETTAYGLTLQVDARGSQDADGQRLQHTIDFGDGKVIKYPEAWHTYKEAGDYTVTVTVSDGISETTEVKVVSVQPVAGNKAPIARLVATIEYDLVMARATSSYDEEGSPLTYEWDFGVGAYIGEARASAVICSSSSSASSGDAPRPSAFVTLTVSDGELKDTIQYGAGGKCGGVYDVMPRAEFTYSIDGNTLNVDGSLSRDETGFTWDFGDGTTATGLKAKHTYAQPGTYLVRLSLSGPSMLGGYANKTIVIGGTTSSVGSSVPSSAPATSSNPVSSSTPSSSSLPSSLTTSSPRSTSSSVSSQANTPVAVADIASYGLTLHVDARGSTSAAGDKLEYSIDFGDGTVIRYPEAWHTYMSPGEYSVTVTVFNGISHSAKTEVFNLQVGEGNRAPVARLTALFEYSTIAAHGTSSYDEEGVPLTYEWDFGKGAYIGNALVRENVCGSSSSGASSSFGWVTLTVSDGELKDTIQRRATGNCGSITDILPKAEFIYSYKGYQVSVDASASRDETSFQWDFGDGATGTGLKATHTYAVPGTYTIQLRTTGPSLFSNTTSHEVHIGGYGVSSAASSVVSSAGSSIASSIPSSVASSSVSSSLVATSSSVRSSVSSPASSSVRSSSSAASSDRNHYNAPRATTAPVIDGVADAVWERASWAPIDVFWLGTQPNPSPEDYTGRYKALWDEDFLYVLVDVTDDRLYDGVRDPLDRYWEDDTVELFIDENRNGGQHGYNTSAWAYHISTYLDVVDSTTGGAKLLNDHIDARLVSNGTKHLWEMRIRIYGEDYADWKANTPLKLYSGKLMGFSASYIDNDGSPQRESMMGSVDTPGHKNNQGYLDASVFGSMRLVE